MNVFSLPINRIIMNNMYKPNLIPVLLLVFLTSLAVACEDNNKDYNDMDKDNNVHFPHTPDPEIPNNPDTYTNSVRSSDSTVDSAMRR